MPSSMCWPFLFPLHFWADAIFAFAKTSGISLRRKSPRWFTQAPRLVETVTSGEVVTIRSARSPPCFERSSRMRPKAACVDCSSPAGAGMAGTATLPKLRVTFLPSDAATLENGFDTGPRIVAQAFERLPLLGLRARPSTSRSAGQLGRIHQAGVIVLVPREGQSVALDRPCDEQCRDVVLSGIECLGERLHAMTAEVRENATRVRHRHIPSGRTLRSCQARRRCVHARLLRPDSASAESSAFGSCSNQALSFGCLSSAPRRRLP